MANEVVIGNLADDKRDAVVQSGALLSSQISVKKIKIMAQVKRASYFQYVIDTRDNGGDYYLYIKASDVWGSATTGAVTVDSQPVSGFADFTDSFVPIEILFDTPQELLNLLSSNISATSGLWAGNWESIEMFDTSGTLVFSTATVGEFGATFLESSVGSETVSLLGAQWWKKDVDQAFADPLTYRSQLPATPVEVQHVTYTDKTQPYYPTGDPFWGLYTPTWLTVASLGGNVYLLRQSGLNYSLSMGL